MRSLIPHEFPIQACALYRLRFVLCADLRQDRPSFGRLSPPALAFPAALHLPISESVGAALPHRRLAAANLQGKLENALPPPLILSPF